MRRTVRRMRRMNVDAIRVSSDSFQRDELRIRRTCDDT